jgi:DNA-binding transcriptional LysR family regulator
MDTAVIHPPSRKRPDPTTLKLFVRVIEEGSFKAVAAKESMAVSAISKRLSELEQMLAVKLLQRTHNGMGATPAGVLLLEQARMALAGFEQVYAQMRGHTAGRSGRVRVLADLGAIVRSAADDVRAFMSLHRSIDIQLEESESEGIADAVAGQSADIGICLALTGGTPLEALPYHRDRLVLITPSGHPLARRRSASFVQTLDFCHVGHPRIDAIHQKLVGVALESGRDLKIRAQVTSYAALCCAVHAGLGIGVVPGAIAASYAKALRIAVVPLDDPWAEWNYNVYIRNDRPLSSAGKLFVDYLAGGEPGR